MNLDFHYYATYLAAKVAGFSTEDAKVIAHASQYVDVSTKSMVRKELLPGIMDATPTIEENMDMLVHNVHNYDQMVQESEAIWRSFHFLPGNIHKNDPKRIYGGKKEHVYLGMSAKYGKEEERVFTLLCLPNSILSEQMVNQVVESKRKNKEYWLEQLGICAHVLADTWAHCYFAGTPSWWVNEVDTLYQYNPNGKTESERMTHEKIKLGLTPPPMFSYVSYAYMGHGRAGHIPDEPYRRYHYRPQWSYEDVVKENPKEFIKAFAQLVYAMMCVKKGYYFERDRYAFDRECSEEEKELLQKIENIFCRQDYSEEKAEDFWRELVDEYTEDDEEKKLPIFDKEKWIEEAKGAQDENEKIQTHYYRFNLAASMHRFYVTKYLRRLFMMKKTEERRTHLDATAGVFITKTVYDENWQYASPWFQYLAHDGTPWLAQYLNGMFYVYPKGKMDKEWVRTESYIEYIGGDERKYRTYVEGEQFKIVTVDEEASANEEKISCELSYLSWNGHGSIARLAKWNNVDDAYLNGDFREKNMVPFIVEEGEEKMLKISPRVQYVERYEKANQGSIMRKKIFEYMLCDGRRVSRWFRVNDEETDMNVLRPDLDILLFRNEETNMYKLFIDDGIFSVGREVEDGTIQVVDWDGKTRNVSMVTWLETTF